MIIKHHLSNEILSAYTAGTLPEAFSLVVATHMSMCDECRAEYEALLMIGGSLLEDIEGEQLAKDSLDQTMAKIKAGSSVSVKVHERRASNIPAPLADYVGTRLESISWRSIGVGAKQSVIKTHKSAKARLLYIPAGMEMPDHGHRGLEMTLVLSGAYRDSVSRFGPGDIELANDALCHQPIAEPGEDCICLTATEGPLRMQGVLPRLAQKIYGI